MPLGNITNNEMPNRIENHAAKIANFFNFLKILVQNNDNRLEYNELMHEGIRAEIASTNISAIIEIYYEDTCLLQSEFNSRNLGDNREIWNELLTHERENYNTTR